MFRSNTRKRKKLYKERERNRIYYKYTLYYFKIYYIYVIFLWND